VSEVSEPILLKLLAATLSALPMPTLVWLIAMAIPLVRTSVGLISIVAFSFVRAGALSVHN
jgi:hypothetical protein